MTEIRILRRWHSLPLSLRFFSIKFLHNLLPLQHRQHKFGLSPSASCPSACGCSDETKDHFLSCPHPQRTRLWREYLDSIEKLFTKWNIDPNLRRTWILLIAPFVGYPVFNVADLPTEHQILYTTQLEIGPNSLFEGLLCTSWLDLQEEHLSRNKLPRKNNQAFSGLKALLNQSIHHVHEIWLTRNSHLHVSNPQTKFCYIHSHLLKQVKALYDSAPHMLVLDREIFSKPYEDRETHSTRQLKQFYDWAKPLVKQSLLDAAKHGTNFKTIDKYFLPQKPKIPAHLFDVINIPLPRQPTLL